MNNLPAVIPEIPDWFLGEIDDVLELLKGSNNKKKHSIITLPELAYLLQLPDRLFRSKVINAGQRNNFQESLGKIYCECENSLHFLKEFIFLIYKSGFLKADLVTFKNIRDVLLGVVRATCKTEEGIQKQVAKIIEVDNKFFPEVLPGEVVGPDESIIDTVYRDFENASDEVIKFLFQEDYPLENEIVTIYKFFGELLSLHYINGEMYTYLIEASGKDIQTALCTGLVYAVSGGFYDDNYSLKQSLAYLVREYYLDNNEKGLWIWAEDIFYNHQIILADYTASP